MSIDKGSLRYKIDLDSQEAIEGTLAFRKSLIETRRAWRKFRTDIRSVGSESRGIAASLKALATATNAGAKAQERAALAAQSNAKAKEKEAQAEDRETASTKKQTAAKRKLSDVEKQIKKTRAQARLARLGRSDKELRSARIGLQISRQRLKAEDKLRILQKLSRQGRDITTGEIPAERAKREILEAQGKLLIEQARLDDKALMSAQTELSVTQRMLRVEQERLRTKALADQGRLSSGLTAEQAGLQSFNRELEGLRIAKVRKELQAANPEFQRLKEEIRGGGKEAQKTEKRFKGLRSILGKTNDRANRISFTFRRLIGIFAAFTLLRTVTRFFSDMVRGAVSFNAAIEQSVLGIASLFTAVGSVRDATGEAVGASHALALAQRESSRQINLLRKNALATVATFQELRDTFQVAIAPGVDAGLGIDQIRKFSIQISQAAAAIGLQQNQLAEEIRSILAGTIQLRTTRIAAALGITNEDIRQAKELGVLAEFLDDRFGAFTTAGEEALKLFNAVLARVRDAVQEMLRLGSADFFVELKGLLDDVFQGLVSINDEGITINPKAVGVVKALFSGLQRAVAEGRRLLSVLTLRDFERSAQNVGDLIGFAAESIGSIIQGFVAGSKDLAKILSPVADTLKGLLPGDNIQEQLQAATRLATVVIGLSVSWKLVAGFVSLIVGPIIRIGLLAKKIFGYLGGWSGILETVVSAASKVKNLFAGTVSTAFLLGAAIAIALFELARITAEVFGIELKFGTIVKIIKVQLVGAFKFAAATIKLVWLTLVHGLETGFGTLMLALRESIYGLLQLGLDVAKRLGKDVSEQLKRLEDGRSKARREYLEGILEGNAKIKLAAKELKEVWGAVGKDVAKGVGEALRDNATAETADEFIERMKAKASGAFDDLFGPPDEFANEMETAATQARDLVKEIRLMPGILSRSARGVKGLEETMRDLVKELTQAKDQMDFAAETQGVQGVAEEFRAELLDRRIRLAKEEVSIRAEISKQETALATAQAKTIRLQKETNRLHRDDAHEVDGIVAFGKDLLTTETKLIAAKERLGSLEAIRASLVKKGRDEEAAAIAADIATQQERIDQLKSDVGLNAQIIESLLQSLGTVADDRVLDLVKERIAALGEEVVRSQEIDGLNRDRITLEERINELTNKRLVAIALRQKAFSRDRLIQLNAELSAERRLQAFASSLTSGAQGAEVAEANAALDIELSRLKILRLREEAQRLANQQTLKDLRTTNASEAQILEIKEAQLQQQQALNMELQLQEISVKSTARALDEAAKRSNEPFSQGMLQAFADFEATTNNSFEIFKEIGTSALEDFAATASGLLTDIFDPTKAVNSDAIEEAFGQLFLRIADQAFNALISRLTSDLIGQFVDTGQDVATDAALAAAAAALEVASASLGVGAAAVATSAAGLTTSAGGLVSAAGVWVPVVVSLAAVAQQLIFAAAMMQFAGGSSVPGLGGVTGGLIPGSANASFAHSRARGFAGGGGIFGRANPAPTKGIAPALQRPKNLDRRDTVPIWAQEGEFMMRLKAVRQYGVTFMRMVNDGLLDPTAVRALMGSRAAIRAPRHLEPGFAEGGLVSSRLNDANTIARQASQTASNRGLLQRAIIVPDEETMERLLAAGPESQAQWMQENQDSTNAALSS